MISFIVIGRNEGWRLEKCFKSLYSFVKAEGIEEFEVVYVDSKSTDDSVKLSLSYGNKTIIIEGECNAAIGRNIGAKEAKGDILFFIDGDMELIPGFWRDITHEGKLFYPFVSGVENDVLHDNEWNYVETKRRRGYIKGRETYEMTTGGLFVITSELWRKVGGMDNRQKKCQDLDLGFWLYRSGYKLLRKPEQWVNHYTRYYAVRSGFNYELAKYQSLLTRKHIFSLPVLLYLLRYNYSFWILSLCLVLMIITKTIYPILLYLIVILYRAYSRNRRTNTDMGYISMLKLRLLEDISFLFYSITFWPKQPQVRYRVEKELEK